MRRFVAVFIAAIFIVTIPITQKSASAQGTPTPSVSISAPATADIGATIPITVTFNSSGDPGYGPVLDIVLDSSGAETGDITGEYAPQGEGIFYVPGTMEYANAALTPEILTFPDATATQDPNCTVPGQTSVEHTLYLQTDGTPHVVCGDPGDTLLIVELPFGSFVEGQPAIDVTFDVDMSSHAELGEALNIWARGGYQYGANSLDDFCCDAVILNPDTPNSSSWTPTDTITPTLIALSKTNNAPEGERTTGPNWPVTWTVNVDVAAGQTVTALTVTDYLPDNVVVTNVTPSQSATVTINGEAASYPYGPAATSDGDSNGTNDNEIAVTFASVNGDSDASFTVTFYFPLRDADGTSVLNPTTGDDGSSTNRVDAVGSWTPIDPDDDDGIDNVVVGPCPNCPGNTVTPVSIAIQKSDTVASDVAPTGTSPGDLLTFTLNFQMSDYFGAQAVVITDEIGDGYRLEGTPQLRFNGEDGATTALADFDAANFTYNDIYDGGANNDLILRVSDELITRGTTPSGRVLGGCVPPDGTTDPDPECSLLNDGGTSGTITYTLRIQDEYATDYPSLDPSIDQGDILLNDVGITGVLLETTDPETLTGEDEEDRSNDQNMVIEGSLEKTVYAINGQSPGAAPYEISAGDIVTYRLTYSLPTSDIENLTLTDFLPLPVFDVDDPDQSNGTATAFAYSYDRVTSLPFTATGGIVQRGPTDTFTGGNAGDTNCPANTCYSGITPTVNQNSGLNSVTLTYGDYDHVSQANTVVDLLISVAASDEPFADRLFLTNQAQMSYGTTQEATQTADDYVQIIMTEPVMQITKGATGSSNSAAIFDPTTIGPVTFLPAGDTSSVPFIGILSSDGLESSPVDSGIGSVDAGDIVRFAVVLENSGSGTNGVYDIVISDSLPAGYTYPPGGINLHAALGNRTVLSTRSATTGDPITDATLFTEGIEVYDPNAPTGPVCQHYDEDDGTNVIVVTYDLLLEDTVEAGDTLTNTVTLDNYAATDGGENFAQETNDPRYSDDADTDIAEPDLTKAITAITPGHSGDLSNASIGEIVTYTLTIDVPEGVMHNVVVDDTIPDGMALVAVDSITPSATTDPELGLDTDGDGTVNSIDFSGIIATANTGTNGDSLSLSFGTIANETRDNGDPETLTIVYRAVILNIEDNQNDTDLGNTATLTWDQGDDNDTATVNVIEPNLRIEKNVGTATGDAGDGIEFTLRISHRTASTADAFSVELTDEIPDGFAFVENAYNGNTEDFELRSCSGTPTSGPTYNVATDTITASWDSLADGDECTIAFTVNIDNTSSSGDEITNEADITWTSTDDTQPADATTYNANGVERTGDTEDQGGSLNNYSHNDDASVTIDDPEIVKTQVATSDANTGTAQHDNTVTDLAIGEEITYQITVTLPEGTNTVEIYDYLPTDSDGIMEVVSSEVISIGGVTTAGVTDGGNLSGGTLSVGASGSHYVDDGDTTAVDDTVLFDFGTVLNTPDGTETDADRIVVQVTARVVNDTTPTNVDGLTLTNTATVEAGSQSASDTYDSEIVEPDLTITKGIIASDNTAADDTLTSNTPENSNITQADAGDQQTFRATVQNTGTGPAYSVTIIDTPDSNLTNCAASSVSFDDGSTPTYTDNGLFTGGILLDASNPLLPGGTIDASGQDVLFVDYTCDVAYTALQGATYTNTATVDYTSQHDGTGTIDERAYDQEEDSATTTLAVSAAEKRITASSENHTDSGESMLPTDPTVTPVVPVPVAVGEVIRYQLAISIPEGYSEDIILSDQLADGIQLIQDDTMELSTLNFATGFDSVDFGSNLEAASTGTVDLIDSSNAPVFTSPFNLVDYNSGTNLLTFNLGDITNEDDDADTEYLVITFNVVVANNAATDLNDVFANDFEVYTDNTDSVSTLRDTSNEAQVVVQEPQLTITKGVNPTTGDAGDTVTYTLQVTNANNTHTASAFDVVLTDVLHASLNLTGVSVTAPHGYTDNSDTSTDSVSVTFDRIDPGETGTITLTVTLRNSVIPNQDVTNTAQLTYTSLPGTGTATNPTGSTTPGTGGETDGERTGDNVNYGVQNDYNGSDDATVSIDQVVPEKAIIATSDANTDNNGYANAGTTPVPVAIGETVTFQLTVDIPEGTSDDVILSDILVPGIEYVAGSAYAYTNSASTMAFNPDGGYPTSAPGVPIPADGDGTTPAAPGTVAYNSTTRTVEINLGDVTNFDNDSGTEQIVVTFQVTVVNTGTVSGTGDSNNNGINDTGDIWANDFDVTVASNDPVTSTSVSVIVVEPDLTLDKTRTDSGLVDAGDTVAYTITLTHTGSSTADAHNIVITDTLPTDDTYIATPATLGGTCTSVTLDQSARPDVTFTVPTLALSDTSCTITYELTVGDDVTPATTYRNSAVADYDSLTGGGGRTNTSNTDSGDDNTFTTDTPTIAKGIQRTLLSETHPEGGTDQFDAGVTDLAIGETVTYALTVTLIEGDDLVEIVDTLPAGLVPVSAEVTSIGGSTTTGDTDGGNITATNSTTTDNLAIGDTDQTHANITISGQVVTFDFGSLYNSSDNTTDTQDQLVVEITARVDNIPANANDADLINDADLNYFNSGTTSTSEVTVEVVEPDLTIAKEIVTSGPTSYDAGDTVSYRITITNNATTPSYAPAYDVAMTDTLDSNLELVVGSVTASVTPGGTSGTVVAGNTTGDTSVNVSLDVLEIGETLTITYNATIINGVTANTTIENTAQVNYHSAPDTVTNRRSYGPEEDSESLTTSVPVFTKEVLADSTSIDGTAMTYGDATLEDLTIGEEITYVITAEMPEGTNSVVVQDNLPAALVPVSVTIHSMDTQVSSENLNEGDSEDETDALNDYITYTDVNAPNGLMDTVTIDFGDVTNTPNGGGTDAIVIHLTARVAEDSAATNNDGETKTNSATMTYNSTDTLTDTADVDIVEPVVGITKSFSPTEQIRGGTVTMTLVVDNLAANGATAPLYDIRVQDTLDDWLNVTNVATTFNAVASSSIDTDNSVLTAGFAENVTDEIDVLIDVLPIDGIATVTVTMQVDPNADPSDLPGTITNTAEVTGHSTPDDTDTDREYTDDDDANLSLAMPDLVVSKSDNTDPIAPGAPLTYTITVTNNGTANYPATNVQLTDELPTGFTPSLIQTNQGTCSAVVSGSLSCNLGTIAQNETVTITIAGITASGLTDGTVLTNIAYVTSDEGNHGNDGDDTADDNDDARAEEETTVARGVDIAVTKRVHDPSPNEGDPVIFEMVVSNNGPSDATDVTLSDTLPAGLTFSRIVPNTLVTGGQCTGGATINCNFPSMPAGTSVTVSVVAIVDTETSGSTLVNTVTVGTTSEDELDNTNNTASATLLIDSVDLQVTKTVDNDTPNEGDTVNFTVTVRNNGPAPATGIEITDLLPAGVTYASDDSATTSTTYNSTSGVWVLTGLTLDAGDDLSLIITATVDTGANALTQPIVNTASVSAVDQPDSDDTNDSDTANLAVDGLDLRLSKGVDNAAPDEGETIVYSIVVENLGAANATNVQVTDILPSGVTYVSDSSSDAYNETNGIWTVGSINNGQNARLDITATVNAGTAGQSFTNNAEITNVDPTDSNPDNNSDAAIITVNTVDVSIEKTVNNPTPTIGDSIVYTLTVTNSGPGNATGVTVTDGLPGDVSWTSDDSNGDYVPATGTWTVGDLANGETATLNITVTVDSGTVITNTAAVSINETDSNASNNEDDASVTIGGLDLALEKRVDNATPDEGDSIVYTITVTNNGPGDATNIEVTDALPAGVSYDTDDSGGTYNTTSGIWAVGDLLESESATLNITATVDAGTSGGTAIVNAAEITGLNEDDGNPDNDRDTAEINVAAVDIMVEKTVDNIGPASGENVTYTITVTNNGPGDATGINIREDLPLDGVSLSYVSDTPSQGTFTQGVPGYWDVGDLASGASATLALEVTVNITDGSIVNTASVLAVNENDTNPDNDTDEATITIGGLDLGVTKTVDNETPAQGDTVTYSITAINNGPGDATGVTVEDILPAGVSYQSDNAATLLNSAGNPTDFNTDTGNWNIGDLAEGESLTLTIDVTVDINGGAITNTATISGDQPDPNPDNDTDEARLSIDSADLSLIKLINTVVPAIGDDIVYTVIVRNSGPSTAYNVVVEDRLPASVDYTGTHTASQGSVTANTTLDVLTWTVGEIPVGGAATLELTVEVLNNNAVINVAEIMTSDQHDPDSTPGNNDLDEDDQAESAFIFDPPFGRKVFDEAGLPQLEWNLVWVNPGTNPVTATIVDPVTVGSYVDGSLSCTSPGTLVTTRCEYDIITNSVVFEGTIFPDPGATPGNINSANNRLIMSFRVNVSQSTLEIYNVATMSTIDDTIEISARWVRGSDEDQSGTPELEIQKSVTPGLILDGETATWTITVLNNSAWDATAVVLRDTVPAPLRIEHVAMDGAAVTVSGQEITAEIATLEPNGYRTMTIVTRLVGTAPEEGFIVNTATVYYGDAEASDDARVEIPGGLPNTGYPTTTP